MKYYIFTIEQIPADGGYAEYAKVQTKNTYNAGLQAFYNALSIVAGNIEKGTETFMDIKLVNSKGGIEKKDQVGEYQTEAPTPTPTPETPTEETT